MDYGIKWKENMSKVRAALLILEVQCMRMYVGLLGER